MKKKIFFWAPFLEHIGTVKSTMNSALSLKRYCKNYEVYIINTCGEWDSHKKLCIENSIHLLNLNINYFKFLPKGGFIFSRFSYFCIYLLSFLPLIFLLKKHKPQILFLHLITSLPLTILKLFNFETDFVLRISGYPKLNIVRKILWRSVSDKIKFITCPTKDLKLNMEESEIFERRKLFYLPDAIMKIKDLKKEKNFLIPHELPKNKKIILSVGRLTKQKNHFYLIKEFSKFLKKNDQFILLIVGKGEKKKELLKLIKKDQLDQKVFFTGFRKNVYSYMRKSDVLVLSSLWEEVGFVIVEAAFCNTFVISSDCPNGPREFLENGRNGILFKNNEENALYKSFEKFTQMEEKKIFENKVRLKKNSKKYSIFNHYSNLNKIMKINNY